MFYEVYSAVSEDAILEASGFFAVVRGVLLVVLAFDELLGMLKGVIMIFWLGLT